MKAYRVITDEPVGFTLGFKPKGEVEYDEYDLISDDDSDVCCITKHGELIISKDIPEGLYQEPDMLIWRNEYEFDEWLKETRG